MMIRIDQNDDEPLYLQIRSEIVTAIAQGELLPHDALPSVRQLACDLGVNLHTVNKAYAVLQDEGYVTMRGRRGTVVADFPLSATNQQRKEADERLLASLKQLALEHRARGGSAETFISLAASAVQSPSSETQTAATPCPSPSAQAAAAAANEKNPHAETTQPRLSCNIRPHAPIKSLHSDLAHQAPADTLAPIEALLPFSKPSASSTSC